MLIVQKTDQEQLIWWHQNGSDMEIIGKLLKAGVVTAFKGWVVTWAPTKAGK